jgi:nucleoside-diphosphate-sugar epimerase
MLMRVFVTGATGFIGTAVVKELIEAGHQVVGLTRSDAGAQLLRSLGAEAHRGELSALESLAGGAAQSDGVIHAAFDHNFANFSANCEKDRQAIVALGEALAGSGRPLIITSSTGMGNVVPGKISTERDFDPGHPNPRVVGERAADSLVAAGVNVSVVRLPQVHDPIKQGLIPYAIGMARDKGISAYVGDGANRWPAVHVSDAAKLYRLALEAQTAGRRYHAVAEQGVPLRAIAEVIGRGLKIPVVSLTPPDAAAHFTWLNGFIGKDLPASSDETQQWLNWHPMGPGLIDDLNQMRCFDAAGR